MEFERIGIWFDPISILMLLVLNSLKQVQNLQDKFWITAFIDNKIASFHTTSSSTNLVFYLLVLVIHVVPKNRDIQHAPAQTKAEK